MESRTQEWEPERNKAGSKWNQEPKSGNKRGTKIENPQVETREEQSGKEQSATCGAGWRIDRCGPEGPRPQKGHTSKLPRKQKATGTSKWQGGRSRTGSAAIRKASKNLKPSKTPQNPKLKTLNPKNPNLNLNPKPD